MCVISPTEILGYSPSLDLADAQIHRPQDWTPPLFQLPERTLVKRFQIIIKAAAWGLKYVNTENL